MKRKILIIVIFVLLTIPVVFFISSNIPKNLEITYSCVQYRMNTLSDSKTISVKLSGKMYKPWFGEKKFILDSFEAEGYSPPPDWKNSFVDETLTETNKNVFDGHLDYKGFKGINGRTYTEIYTIGPIMISYDTDKICIMVHEPENRNPDDSSSWGGDHDIIIAGSINGVSEVNEADTIRKELFGLMGHRDP